MRLTDLVLCFPPIILALALAVPSIAMAQAPNFSGKWIQDTQAFDVWVGADSLASLHADLEVVR